MAWKRKYAGATSQVSLRLPDDLLQAVDRKAKRRGKARTDIIVAAVAAAVKTEPALVDVPEPDAFS